MSYKVVGWFDLSLTTTGEGELSRSPYVDELRRVIDRMDWGNTTIVDVHRVNLADVLTIVGDQNHTLGIPELLTELLQYVGTVFPGSYGLLYEYGDEDAEQYRDNHLRLRVMTRGKVTDREDPFFSPMNPTIED